MLIAFEETGYENRMEEMECLKNMRHGDQINMQNNQSQPVSFWKRFQKKGIFLSICSIFQRIPKFFLKKIFHFQAWHVSSYSERSYAQAIVRHLNDRSSKKSVVEMGCGLGDILRRLQYVKRIGLDREQEALNAAYFIAKLKRVGQEPILFQLFDFLVNELVGQYDVIIMVNWIHNIPPDFLKKKIELFFKEHLHSGGELVFDVVKEPGYRYHHDLQELTSNCNGRVEILGPFAFNRRIVMIHKN